MKNIKNKTNIILLIVAGSLVFLSIFLPWTKIISVNVYGFNYLGGTFATNSSAILMLLLIIIAVSAFIQSILQSMNRWKPPWLIYIMHGLVIFMILFYFYEDLAPCNIGPVMAAIAGAVFCVTGLKEWKCGKKETNRK